MHKSLPLLASWLLFGCAGQLPTGKLEPANASAAPQDVCRQIAADIEALRGRFPQLREFAVARNLDGCRIRYEYRCQPPSGTGGWTGAVPRPNADGVWLYVSLWDPSDAEEASRQIHTQPVVPEWYIDKQRVTFLVLEGADTSKVSDELMRILTKHGLR